MKRKIIEDVPCDYKNGVVHASRVVQAEIMTPPWPVLYEIMRFRADYIMDVREFIRDRGDSRAGEFVFVPIFKQLNRSVESVGRNVADAFAQASNGNSVSAYRNAYGSLLESTFFLSCLPPPFSTRILNDLESFEKRFGAFVRKKLADRHEKLGNDKEARSSRQIIEEMMVRMQHNPPAVYYNAKALALRVIDDAVLYLERRCSVDDLEIDGPEITSAVECLTCMPANIIEGFGRFGMSMNMSFLFNARAGLWKFIGTAMVLPPPFSTTHYDAATLIAVDFDQHINDSTNSVIKGMIQHIQ